MASFYTYMRPSDTKFITLPDITLDMSSFFKSNNGVSFAGIHEFKEYYDNNLFGYALITADVEIHPNIRWYTLTGGGWYGNNVGKPEQFDYPTVKFGIEYPNDITNKRHNIEVPPKNHIFFNSNKTESELIKYTVSPPTSHINFTPDGSNGADIYMNVPFSYQMKGLLKFSPHSEIKLSIVGESPDYMHNGGNTEGIRYTINGIVYIRNIRIYRENFVPPINQLGVL